MIARILEQQQAICAVLAEDRKNWHRMPSDHEFTILEAMSSVLKPLSTFTDALSGEKVVTVSAVRPLLKHILEELLAISADDCSLVKEMKETISDDLSAGYLNNEMSELIDKCSYLDPRFRTRYLNNEEETLLQIKSEATEIADNICQDVQEEVQPPPTKKSKGLGAILAKVVRTDSGSQPSPTTSSERVDKEMKLYLERPVIDPDSDPLIWWLSERKKLPVIAELARKYLCACGTSVPSECLFSKAGFIVNDYRNRLSPQNVNMLVFLAKSLP